MSDKEQAKTVCKTIFHPLFWVDLFKKVPLFRAGLFGAANQIRTGDLVLTKDVLYHLSHSSIPNM